MQASPGPHPILWWALWACLGLGLSVTVLLLVQQSATVTGELGLPGCSTGGKFDCDKVLSSAYGKIAGVSITWFALGYYVLAAGALGVAALAARRGAAPVALFAPLIVGTLGLATAATWPWLLAVLLQAPGLLAERWLFFAQARHPQNLYYQTVS